MNTTQPAITRRHRMIEELLVAIMATCTRAGLNVDADLDKSRPHSAGSPDLWAGYKVTGETLDALLKLRKPLKESAASVGFMEIENGDIVINMNRRLAA